MKELGVYNFKNIAPLLRLVTSRTGRADIKSRVSGSWKHALQHYRNSVILSALPTELWFLIAQLSCILNPRAYHSLSRTRNSEGWWKPLYYTYDYSYILVVILVVECEGNGSIWSINVHVCLRCIMFIFNLSSTIVPYLLHWLIDSVIDVSVSQIVTTFSIAV